MARAGTSTWYPLTVVLAFCLLWDSAAWWVLMAWAMASPTAMANWLVSLADRPLVFWSVVNSTRLDPLVALDAFFFLPEVMLVGLAVIRGTSCPYSAFIPALSQAWART